jgi:hypothetical protein
MFGGILACLLTVAEKLAHSRVTDQKTKCNNNINKYMPTEP